MVELLVFALLVVVLYAGGVTGQLKSLKSELWYMSEQANSLSKELRSANSEIDALKKELLNAKQSSDECWRELHKATARLNEIDYRIGPS